MKTSTNIDSNFYFNLTSNSVCIHSAKNAWIRSHILPYWDRLLPYIGIRRPYTAKYRIVFRRFSGSDCHFFGLYFLRIFSYSLFLYNYCSYKKSGKPSITKTILITKKNIFLAIKPSKETLKIRANMLKSSSFKCNWKSQYSRCICLLSYILFK